MNRDSGEIQAVEKFYGTVDWQKLTAHILEDESFFRWLPEPVPSELRNVYLLKFKL